jgi:hypothetical protein
VLLLFSAPRALPAEVNHADGATKAWSAWRTAAWTD